jgi:ribosome-binding ATPase YchF (GTP1/OBG family)
MKLGIIGLPQTGKKLLFELLTGAELSATAAADRQKGLTGVAEIKDGRVNALVDMYKPKKEARARIDLKLLPGFEPGSTSSGGQDFFKDIADVDALCHVVRAFSDSSVYHVNGSVNPARDIENVNGEIFLHDLIFIEKRQERIDKDRKKKEDKRLQDEDRLLTRFREHLEADRPLRTLEISEEEQKLISGYPFLTKKPVLVVINTGDSAIPAAEMETLKKQCAAADMDLMQVPVKLEGEIARLESGMNAASSWPTPASPSRPSCSFPPWQ